ISVLEKEVDLKGLDLISEINESFSAISYGKYFFGNFATTLYFGSTTLPTLQVPT
ncbi:MAG: hypothetical protein QG670_2020, partial [Thermoproteota archaeon]|nr:hypothetical protein [Thermoproteota archaeon]